MSGLYDAYNLSNSRSIPQYQGSTIPELTQTANVLEGRYDQGVQNADLLDRSINNSSAASVDQPILTSLKNQYRDKLKGYVARGDYENMYRNVAMDANDFNDKYKTIAANAKAINDWSADLDKRVTEGKVDPNTATLRKAQMQDTYTGLKVDPATGQMTNHFSGLATMPSVDIPKKVNEWLEHTNAIEKGWKAEKDVNGWYITNGTEKKSLPWEKLKPIIDAGMATDPEVKGWLAQEQELAPYQYGLTKKMSIAHVQDFIDNSPTLGPKVQQQIVNGVDPVKAVHDVVSTTHTNSLINGVYDYARKGVVDSQKSEYAEKMDPITEERMKKQGEHNMFSVPYSDVTPGVTINSEADYDAEHGKAKQGADAITQQITALQHAPGVTAGPNGTFIRHENDGSTTDITADISKLQDQQKSAQDKVTQLENVKTAAANAVNYHPDQSSPALKAQAQKEADDYKTKALAEASNVYENSRNGPILTGHRQPSQDEIDAINKRTSEMQNQSLSENHPAYKSYVEELKKRLAPQGTSNKMWVFNDDNKKKALEDYANSSIKDLGVDKGLGSLTMGSGKNQGQELSASDYDDLKGKMHAVGIVNDATSGETKVIMRADQDIKGKKIKGENLVLRMKDVGGIDNYMKSNLPAQEYADFTNDRVLKAGMNNTAGSMNYPIQTKDGSSNIQITRRKSQKDGPGAFSVRIPTASGWKSVPADSYEGVISIINQVQGQHQ